MPRGRKRGRGQKEARKCGRGNFTLDHLVYFPRGHFFRLPEEESLFQTEKCLSSPSSNQSSSSQKKNCSTDVSILYSTLYQEKRQTAAAVFKTQQKPPPQQSFSSSLFPGPLISIAAIRRGRSSNRGRGGGTGDGGRRD